MKKHTQAEFGLFEVIAGIKQYPSGDHTEIKSFGEQTSDIEICGVNRV